MSLFPPDQLVLEDERALLRCLQPEDVSLLLPFMDERPLIWSTFSSVKLTDKEDMVRYVSDAIKQKSLQREFPFIVFDKQTKEWAGSTRFYDIQPDHQTAQLGYTWYGGKFQRTGLNRHCKWLLLNYAFETWHLERVEFRADAGNARSIEAMKQIGCQVEGILRSSMLLPSGRRRDSIVLSILKQEWFDGVKDKLRTKTR